MNTFYDAVIHHAVNDALMGAPERKLRPEIWVSDLGRNPYGLVRRLITGELEPFDYPTRLKMDNGTAMELATLNQVAQRLNRPVQTQFPLYNEVWSGYADLVIGHGSQDVTIYDHKASAGRWWDYKGSLPRASDMLQVWKYGELYKETYGIQPTLGLYYRGWGTWGEFSVSVIEDTRTGLAMIAQGYITDEKGEEINTVTRTRQVNPEWLSTSLEAYYNLYLAGDLSIEEMEALNPNGPDWDYAEEATLRLAEVNA